MDNLQNFRRTDYCGTFSAANVGQEISVCGWVQRQRNLGGLIFVDLRDRTGLLQLSFDDSTPRDIFEKAASLRGEYVIAAKGLVRERESKNPDLPTGDIEVKVTELRLLAKAETPPFEIVENSDVKDVTRLKYRYLDLRRPDMQRMIALRHKIVKICRRLSGPLSCPPRQVLCPAPVSPAVQAAAHAFRLRPLLPDRPLLPG